MKRFLILFLLLLLGLSPSLDAQTPSKGIWLSREEIAALPVTGTAWSAMKAAADSAWGTPKLSDQNDPDNVLCLAGAFVYARTGDASYRTKVINQVLRIPGSEDGGETLALGRELAAYVIAADLVGLPADKEPGFKAWLSGVRTKTLSGKTLISTSEHKQNNWGVICRYSRIVCAVYLDDAADLARCAKIERGWLGDHVAWNFSQDDFGDDLSWQSDPAHPVGINPKGALIQGHNVDGVLPDEERRAGSFVWPAPKTNYSWTGLEGALCSAWVLSRFGYADIFNVQDKALLRAYTWLHQVNNYPAEGNDLVQIWIVNAVYGTNFPTKSPAPLSRAFGWTDWTHSRPLTPDVPKDFAATFEFHYRADTKDWSSNRLSNDTSKPGIGSTPSTALANWLQVNAGEP
jgi:hypothetical protein